MLDRGKNRLVVAYDCGLTIARGAGNVLNLLTALKPTTMTRTVQVGVVAGLLYFSASALSAAPVDLAVREEPSQLSRPVGKAQEPSQLSRPIRKAPLMAAPFRAGADEFPTAWWNWIFVSLFAFFGCGQFVLLLYQSNVIGKTLTATKRTVDIAERTAAEFETPFLFPVLVSSSVSEDLRSLAEQENPELTASPRVSFTIKNFGRTPALLQRASAVFFVGELEEAHNDPVSGRLPELMLEPLGSLTTPLEREIDRQIDRPALESLKNQTARLYLRGRITFLDVSGNRYEQIFCFTWDLETGGFIPWGPHRNRRKRLSSRRRRLS
jgi:hypothetical protein